MRGRGKSLIRNVRSSDLVVTMEHWTGTQRTLSIESTLQPYGNFVLSTIRQPREAPSVNWTSVHVIFFRGGI